jgi:hypothetical protein
MSRFYCIRETDNNLEPCDILLDHGLKSPDFRTYVIRKEDLYPWKIAHELNNAYQAGREDAMRDLRNFIGVGK